MSKTSSKGIMEIGYTRISRPTQSIERQVRNILSAYPNAHIVQEAYTGTKLEGRKEFERVLKTAKKSASAGQQVRIIFDSVSRMSRNAQEGFETYQDLYSLGVELVFLKEPHINTATYGEAMSRQFAPSVNSGDNDADELINTITEAINRYTMKLAEQQIFLAFQQAEAEVNSLQQRTREGMLTAKLNGEKQIGGVKGKKLKVKKAASAKELILKYSKNFNGILPDEEVIKLAGVARNTYYKYKKELKEGL